MLNYEDEMRVDEWFCSSDEYEDYERDMLLMAATEDDLRNRIAIAVDLLKSSKGNANMIIDILETGKVEM